jgi:glucose-1-phosphate adenylyltransferase
VLAIVQAGGAGSRMDVLTRERAKPTLPFAGSLQLVDFPLSNLAHSGVDDVWLSVQFQGATLEDQVANGRPWNLDRTRGGLRLLMPQQGAGSMDEDGFATGNADELYRIRDRIAHHAPDVVLVMSADHVYLLDYAEVVATHRARDAECTVVTTRVESAEAPDHATVEADDDGRVVATSYKPEQPRSDVVAAEVIAYDPAVLVRVLEELHARLGGEAEEGDSGLGDFGEHLLPAMVERGRTFAHPLDGYWRDLGTPSRYLAAHLDVVTDDVGVLDRPGWPVLTQQPQRRPARLLEGAHVANSLVSPGATVAGQVVDSVVGPGTHVARGAVVTGSVLFSDVVVGEGAAVTHSLVDDRCRIGEGARVGGVVSDAPLDDDVIVLVGAETVVGPDAFVEPGARLEPGSTA